MNPMQLLTASKSLMGIKNASGRYRMAEGNLLPKFNPTVRTPSPAPTVTEELVKQVTRLRMENQAITRLETESKRLSIKLVLHRAREIFLKSGRSAFSTCATAGSLVTGKLGRIKPLSCWKGRQLPAKTEKIRPIKSTVQGELSLDKVKVVRNDLSDADLEVVPVTNVEPAKSTEQVSMLVSQRESKEMSWGRMTTRIFGARKKRI